MAESETTYDFRAINGMDPAANWLLGPAVEDYLGEAPERTPIPFLIEFIEQDAVIAFRNLKPMRDGGTGNGALVLGFGDSQVRKGGLAAAFASLEWFVRLLDDSPESKAVRAAQQRFVLSSPVILPPEYVTRFPDFPPF